MVGVSKDEQADPELVVILGLEPSRIRSSPHVTEGPACPRGAERGNRGRRGPGWPFGTSGRATDHPEGRRRDHALSHRGRVSCRRHDLQRQLVCMPLDDAGKLFALPGYASDFGIYCRPGPGNIQAVRQVALEILGDIPYRLQTKNEEVAAYVDKGFRQQQGVFTVLYLVAFAVGIPALLVASGVGLSERNREIGICKAVGWRTSEVMTMVVFEQVLLSVIAACLAVLICFLWVRLFNGIIVAQFFIRELGSVAAFRVPARFSPVPPAMALLLCLKHYAGRQSSHHMAAGNPPSRRESSLTSKPMAPGSLHPTTRCAIIRRSAATRLKRSIR